MLLLIIILILLFGEAEVITATAGGATVAVWVSG